MFSQTFADIVHGNLTLSNIVKLGSHVAIIDLESATLSSEGEWSSILSDKIGGISQKVASAMLPPEVIERIDLSKNAGDLLNYNMYWDFIHKDAVDLDLLNPDDIHAISRTIKSLQDQIEALKSSQSTSFANIRTSLNPNSNNPEEVWRAKVSRCLDNISINDLPLSLSSCQTFEDFVSVWARLKTNHILWSRLRPRFSSDAKYAYVIKFYNDIGYPVENKIELPYETVPSSDKIDVWGFGVLMFSLCTRSTLFHQTLGGDLQGPLAYEELYNWNKNLAEAKIKSSVKNPLARDLLLRILTKAEDRVPSMAAVLQHPFFGQWSSPAARKMIKNCSEHFLIGPSSSEDASELSSPSDEIEQTLHPNISSVSPKSKEITSLFSRFSMEKICKIVFARLDDIKIPTGFIVLPYKLKWSDVNHRYEAPSDSDNLAKAAKIGKHLLNINTLTAKLQFWLRVKENLAEEKGKEFKGKIINWIQRARGEGSEIIAKEIVSAVKCSASFEAICIEMLDEEMSISHARTFIRDPMKAAAILIHEEVASLLECYEDQFMYIIDENRGCPSLSVDILSMSFQTDGTYPIKIEKDENEFQKFLLPFINIAVMIATANDGLNGLARLLGTNSYPIPQQWSECILGLVHNPDAKGRSSIVEFATIQSVVRKEFKGLYSSIRVPQSISETGSELDSLQAFYQRHDSLGYYAGLHRVHDSQDNSLVFWTQDEEPPSLDGQLEILEGLTRKSQLEAEIVDKNQLEEELIRLNKRLLDLKAKTEAKLLKRKQKKVRVVSPQLPASIPEDNSVSPEANQIYIPSQQTQSTSSSRLSSSAYNTSTPSGSSSSQIKPKALKYTTIPVTSNVPESHQGKGDDNTRYTQQNFVI